MRSLTARLLLTALACLAAGGGAYYLFHLEGRAAERRDALAAFDRTARSVMLSLSGARAAQLAYVAEGQGVAIWQPTVAAAVAAVPGEMDTLRALSGTVEARAMLIEASARLRSFADVGKRAADYVTAGDLFMASDLLFTEGASAIAASVDLVNSAWRQEVESLAMLEAAQRLTATYVAAGIGVSLVLMLLLMAMIPGASAAVTTAEADAVQAEGALALRMRESPRASDQQDHVETADAPPPTPASAPPLMASSRASEVTPDSSLSSVMMTAAEICLALGAVRDRARLRELLGRAASLMEAPGLIVWVGDGAGADLRPTVAHGYSPQALSRIAAIPRVAENAVAAAYRTARLQAVSAPGQPGAVIAPLVTSDGCVGVLSVEVPMGREELAAVRALALLFAAQLSAILGADAESPAAANVTAASA